MKKQDLYLLVSLVLIAAGLLGIVVGLLGYYYFSFPSEVLLWSIVAFAVGFVLLCGPILANAIDALP